MARDRFSDLERVYDALKLGNVQLSSLPQNLDFVKYGNWREGNYTKPTITRPDLGTKVVFGVIAFGYGHTAANAKIKINSNSRANSKLGATSELQTKLGIATSSLELYSENSSFIPALCRVADRVTTGASKISHITGRTYKSSSGSSYTFPMGQGSSERGYKVAIEDVLSSASAATLNFSFSPEEWRRD